MILHFAVRIEVKNDALTRDMDAAEMAAIFVERIMHVNDDLSWVLDTEVALHPQHIDQERD